MRILIGCHEICGWIHLLSSEFERQGHRVISISDKKKYYKEATYTLRKENFEWDYIALRSKWKPFSLLVFFVYKVLKKIIFKLTKRDLYNRLLANSKSYLYNHTDLYIHIWEGVESNDEDLKEFKKRNVKIVSWFVGDDIRYYPTALKEFKVDNPYFLEYTKNSIDKPMRKLRMHEKYSDAIFSVPDQSSLALKPYFHLHVPIDLKKYTYKNTNNDIPVIMHIPSAPLLKGSPVFDKAIQDLKDEGLNFVYKSLNNIPNSEVIRLLSDADILLDELYMHGPGMLGIEAMASGCSVVVKYLENSPETFRPPVMNVNVDNVKEKIRELITNKEKRQELIIRGRAFVEKQNQVSKVCHLILDKINSRDYDYYPTYFRDKFEAESQEDVQTMNELTLMVKECEWYKEYVPEGSRGNLVF